MFGFFKKKKEISKNELKAYVTGKTITIEEVADGIFSEKILGDGMAICPEEGKLYAPADGKVVTVMEDSKHACGLELAGGIQILLMIIERRKQRYNVLCFPVSIKVVRGLLQ